MWTSNRVLPDSSPVPKTPARLRKVVRKRLSGNVVCPFWNSIQTVNYVNKSSCRLVGCKYVLPVVIEYLGEHAWMSVEKILVEHRIVIGQGFGESAEPRGRYFLQCGFIGLVTDTTDV